MVISRNKARLLGAAAVGTVLLLQALNSFGCYQHDFATFLFATSMFVAIPLLPALISLPLKNPLRAVGACALFAPWLVLAYYTDCVRPYSGGGASMIYIAVLFWGTPSAIIGALITGPVIRGLGIEIK
jgi:hypothetical protein